CQGRIECCSRSARRRISCTHRTSFDKAHLLCQQAMSAALTRAGPRRRFHYAEGNRYRAVVSVCIELCFSYAAVYYIVFADCVCHSFSVLFGQVIVSYSLGGQVLAHRVAVKACGIPSHLEEVLHARLARLYVSDI